MKKVTVNLQVELRVGLVFLISVVYYLLFGKSYSSMIWFQSFSFIRQDFIGKN